MLDDKFLLTGGLYGLNIYIYGHGLSPTVIDRLNFINKDDYYPLALQFVVPENFIIYFYTPTKSGVTARFQLAIMNSNLMMDAKEKNVLEVYKEGMLVDNMLLGYSDIMPWYSYIKSDQRKILRNMNPYEYITLKNIVHHIQNQMQSKQSKKTIKLHWACCRGEASYNIKYDYTIVQSATEDVPDPVRPRKIAKDTHEENKKNIDIETVEYWQ